MNIARDSYIAPSDAEGVTESSRGAEQSVDSRSPILLICSHLEEVPEPNGRMPFDETRSRPTWRLFSALSVVVIHALFNATMLVLQLLNPNEPP